LLNYDADPNATAAADGGSPLHRASNAAVVALLVAAGADPTAEVVGRRDKGKGVNEITLTSEETDPEAAVADEDWVAQSAFKLFLERMPEGCNEVLTR